MVGAQQRKPLLIPGKRALYQKVITHPGAKLFTIDGKSVQMNTLLPAKVTSVSFSAAGEMVLNLAGVGKVSLSDVQTIGI